MCATIANFGAPVNFQIDTGGGAVTVTVGQTLQTAAVCEDNVKKVVGTCELGAACKYIWRVDGKAG